MKNPYNIGKPINKTKNTKIPEKNKTEDKIDTQFYLITLEDSNGEHQQLRVFKNSDAAEIAFNFCKENNLDYKSMKYIKKNIQKIIENFDDPNHKLFFLDKSYSSIQEVDEENLISENTLIIDNEAIKEKNNNKNIIKGIKFRNVIEPNLNKEQSNQIQKEENKKYNETKKENLVNDIALNSNNNTKKHRYFNNDSKYRNNNSKVTDKKIELINKIDSIKETKENNAKKSNELLKGKIDLINSNINQTKQKNKNEIKTEKPQEQKIHISNNNQNKKKSIVIDLNLIKEKMNNFRIKNSALNVKTYRNREKENLTERILVNKAEKYKNSQKNINNSNIIVKKNNLLKNKLSENKISDITTENILKKYLKKINKKRNIKVNSNTLTKEEQIKINKTCLENNKKTLLNNTKEKISQKTKINKNRALFNKTDILNNDILQTIPSKENQILKTFGNLRIQSHRITPKKSSNIFSHKKQNSNPKFILKPKHDKIIKLRNLLQINKPSFAKLLSLIFTQNCQKSSKDKMMQTSYYKKIDKNYIKNRMIRNQCKERKNSYVGETTKCSFDFNKYNTVSRNNLERENRILETEWRTKNLSKKGKRSKFIFNDIDKNINDILKTNYIINKRCRILNNKKKKNMSMNLSKHFSINKLNQSKKESLELNLSNNHFTNRNGNDRENDINKNNQNLIKRYSDIFFKNKRNLLNLINPKRIKNKNLNSQNQLTINNYNTNIKNYRLINTTNSDKTWGKMLEIKPNDRNSSSQTKLRKCYYNLANINSSDSSLNKDQNLNSNVYGLKVLDHYYTINNSINITNNDSLFGNFVNNRNNQKFNQEEQIINLLKKIYKYLDKENIGFLILNSKQNIKDIFIQNNLILKKEQEIIIEKAFKLFFEIQKKNNIFELDENKIIINEKSFLKYMNQIVKNKLNANEKNIILSLEKDINNIALKKPIYS